MPRISNRNIRKEPSFKNGEWALVHRCKSCGMIRMNRIAGDDGPLPLLSLAVRPLSRPPFPLDRLLEMIQDEEGGRS